MTEQKNEGSTPHQTAEITAQVLPDRPLKAYSATSGILGYRLARDIIRDPRLQQLSTRSLGAYLLIKAFDEIRQPVSARSKIGASSLRLTVPAFMQVREELETSIEAGQPPLVTEVEGALRAGPVGEPIDASTQRARVRAAERRWEEPAKPTKAVKKEKPAKPVKAAKRTEKATEVLSPAQALEYQRLEEASAAALVKTPPALPLPPQASLFDGLEGMDPAPEQKIPPVPWTWFGETFNRLCPTLPTTKPPEKWTEKRKRQITKQWKMMPFQPQWEAFFTRVEESNFLCGRVNSFKASIDWIIEDGAFLKINEGNYDNRGTTARRGLFSPTADQFRVGTYGNHNIDDVDAPWATPTASNGEIRAPSDRGAA